MYTQSRRLIKDMSPEYDVLAEKMKNDLPIPVYPGRDLVLKLRSHYPKLNINSELTIVEAVNMGNVCGILVKVKFVDSHEIFNCELTHLKIEYSEPLRREIEEYQTKRTQNLAE